MVASLPCDPGRCVVTTIESPAKLTLTLAVTGVRSDGYHLIEAEMVALDLCDLITIGDSDTIAITVDGPHSEGIAVDDTNLVHRALLAAGRTASVHITKNIPHGGGLGGGSSNAAAILRWAGLTDPDRAVTIGADVPFSLVGGRARVTGIGEIVEPLEHVSREITLFVPPVHTPTPLVYRTWDEMGAPRGANHNDLEPAAMVAVPELAHWRDRITAALGQAPRLAGSGSTMFALGAIDAATERFSALIADGLRVVNTTTRPDAGRVVRHQ